LADQSVLEAYLMHIRQFDFRGKSLQQAIVRFPRVPEIDSWWRFYQHRIAAAAGLENVSTAFRLTVRANGSIDRLIGAVFEADKERSARRLFGGMIFLEAFGQRSVAFPNDKAEFDSWIVDLPRLRDHIIPRKMNVIEDVWLACDFRIGEHLDALVREAQSFGFVLGYQAHFRPFSPNPDRQRRVGRNFIRLKTDAPVPLEVLDDQERQSARFRSATLMMEEIVGTKEPESARWLAKAIDRAFKADRARARLPMPDLNFSEGDANDAYMMHSSLLHDTWNDDDLLCSQSDDGSFFNRVFSYRPAIDLRPPPDAGDKEAPRDGPDAPNPPSLPRSEGRGHIFISYKRDDLPRIGSIFQWLSNHSFPIWYDRAIALGTEWDTVLERKIVDAGLILVFLSRAAAESRWCQNEIRLAQIFQKTFLVVALEGPAIEAGALPDGLRFLGLWQQISLQDPEFEARLHSAIRQILGSAAG
jgi:hypothetical protein